MDAKTLAGLSMAIGLTALIVMIASPGTLAVLELALVGALYVLRSRRQDQSSYRARRELARATSRITPRVCSSRA